jgi:hypothetical protein
MSVTTSVNRFVQRVGIALGQEAKTRIQGTSDEIRRAGIAFDSYKARRKHISGLQVDHENLAELGNLKHSFELVSKLESSIKGLESTNQSPANASFLKKRLEIATKRMDAYNDEVRKGTGYGKTQNAKLDRAKIANTFDSTLALMADRKLGDLKQLLIDW